MGKTASDMSALHHSPESLIYAVMSRDVRQVQKLLNFGIVINPSDAWIIYDACLQGPDMIQALASDPNIDLNPTVPQQNGDRVFHFLLRYHVLSFDITNTKRSRRCFRLELIPSCQTVEATLLYIFSQVLQMKTACVC